MPSKPLFLFLCVNNSNRSQMAEAFARIHGGGRIEAHSAGSEPGGAVNPRAIQLMKELGHDLSTHVPKRIEEFADREIDVAVTMGCGEACPFVRARRREEWQIPDPMNMSDDQYREVRDLIESKVKELLGENG